MGWKIPELITKIREFLGTHGILPALHRGVLQNSEADDLVVREGEGI